MFLSENTMGFPADLTVFSDPDGRDWCVAVVKATYIVDAQGKAASSPEQPPLCYADEHYGDPGETSPRYENDFAPHKPAVDVLVNGHVYAPDGKPTRGCQAVLRVGDLLKTLQVSGRRNWVQGQDNIPSEPEPFEQVALRYENAFGGADKSNSDQEQREVDMRNPFGQGFRKILEGMGQELHSLPQLEYVNDPLLEWNGLPKPANFGIVSRGSQPRLGHAGTYDDAWRDERSPFLPADFDMRYFQSAPDDQQLRTLSGGTPVQLENLSRDGVFTFSVPDVRCPIAYRFDSGEEQREMVLDTLLIEPDLRQFSLTWRSRVAIGRKSQKLREVTIGQTAPKGTSEGS